MLRLSRFVRLREFSIASEERDNPAVRFNASWKHEGSQYRRHEAVGRIKWQKGDLPNSFGEGWIGMHTPSGSIFGGDWTIERPLRSWPYGPRREISDEFADAWLWGGATALAKNRPKIATKITLASLIAWPRRRTSKSEMGTSSDKHGFRFLNQRWFPPFWHHGPFLPLLKINRREGIKLIIQLVNFATDRVAEWWPYEDENHVGLNFESHAGPVNWSGHPNIFAWHSYHTNTVEAVTCALMALEKWLMEELEAKRDVQDVVDLLYTKGRSIAFAGLLVCVGKAHHDFLLGPLRSLLSQWHVYIWDTHCAGSLMGTGGGWINDPDFVNKWRQEWREQPHRQLSLQKLCFWLLVHRVEAREVFKGISDAWRSKAATLAEDHPNRVPLLRWASDFDFSTWSSVTLDDGTKAWSSERPPELTDMVAVEEQQRQMQLMTVPLQCEQLLKARNLLATEEAEGWWQAFEQSLEWLEELGVQGNEKMRENPQHTVGGIMAVLLCLGSTWLKTQPERLTSIEATALDFASTMQGRKVWTAQDRGVDVEWFMIRCGVRLWALGQDAKLWRAFCGSAVASFKYEIVRALFDEAFIIRRELGSGFSDLCQFVIAYAEQREEVEMFGEKDEAKRARLHAWHDKWFPKFANGKLPRIKRNWGKTLGVGKSVTQEVDDEAPFAAHERKASKRVKRRMNYGFDVHLLLCAFDCLPTAAPPEDATPCEMAEWRVIEDNLFTAMLRTLPDDAICDDENKAPFPYESEHPILQRIAIRCVTTADGEAERLWIALLQKGPYASRFAQELVSQIKLVALQLSVSVTKLAPIFRAMLQHLETADAGKSERRDRYGDLWRELLFIGRYFDAKDDEVFSALMIVLEPFYEKAVREGPPWDFMYSSLIHHLSGTATRTFLPQVFEWCSKWVNQEGAIHWNDSSLRNAFSLLLDAGWKTSLQSIR